MTHNNITGDKIATKAATEAYRDGHDRIFGKKQEVSEHDRAVRVLQRIEEGKQDAKLGRDLPGTQGKE